MVIEEPYINPCLIKLLNDLDHVRRVAAKPVQFGDEDNIPFLNLYLQGLKPWAVGGAAGRFIGEDPR
jgi:hypothetical protein